MNSFSLALSISAFLLASCSGFSQAQNSPAPPSSAPAPATPEEQAAQDAQTLVKKHEVWMTQITSPGASIEARELSREGAKVTYTLYVKGLPTDKVYTLVSWPVGKPGPFPAIKGVSIDENGQVSCTGRLPGECTDPSPQGRGAVKLTFTPVKGEPFRVALVNGASKAAIAIVPDPILAEDKRCTLEAVRLLPHFELAYLSGAGYKPNTAVSFHTESYGEKHALSPVADANGKIQFAIMPFVTGHDAGTTTISTSGNICSPTLHFDWGAPAAPSTRQPASNARPVAPGSQNSVRPVN